MIKQSRFLTRNKEDQLRRPSLPRGKAQGFEGTKKDDRIRRMRCMDNAVPAIVGH